MKKKKLSGHNFINTICRQYNFLDSMGGVDETTYIILHLMIN